MTSINDKLTYDAGKILLAGAFRYNIKINENNEEIFEPKKNKTIDELNNLYNQAIMRMSGRAAEEIMGLEISIERFYDDLKLAIPHIQNIAIIEGKYFPNIKQDNPKDLDQIYYNKYIMVAKVSINNIANANNFTSDKLIKKITTNIIMLANNRYN